MGKPKQSLPFGSTTLLGSVITTTSRSRLAEIILVLSHMTAQLEPAHELPAVKRVINHAPEDGLSSSLKLGIAAVSPASNGALVLMSDQPHVGVELIDYLVEEFERSRPGALVPLYHGERGSPVLLGRPFWRVIERLHGDVGARELLREHPELVRTVEVGHLGRLGDIDTPEQYAELLRSLDT